MGTDDGRTGSMEITLDVRDDSVALNTVKMTGGADVEDRELSVSAKGLEVRNASSRIRQVSSELKRLTTLSIRKPRGRLDRSKAVATYALKGLKFISKNDGGEEWAAVEKRFDDLTEKTNGLLPQSLFWECIGMNKESKEFAGELFNSLARRRNITDGRITEDEVKKIISLSASANKLSNIKKQAGEYAALIMQELDPDNLGYIMIENLEMLLLQAQTHNMGGESRNLSQLLSQKLKTTQSGNPLRRWYEDFSFFLLDNWQRCWVIVLWIGVMLCLFTWKYIQYKDRAVYKVLGHCVCIAKGSAETLKLNMALILLPVCRNTITWLRNKIQLGVAVPFDDNLNFHKVIGVAISIGFGLHAISHLTCDFPRLIHATEEEYKPMQQYFGDQAKNYWHFVKEVEGYTGIIMVVLMMIAFTLATPWLRRGKLNRPPFVKKLTGFNAFWYSHHLFVIVYTLLIVHGIKLYLTKEWYKKTVSSSMLDPYYKYIFLVYVTVYPGDVLALQMSKPQGFKYKSGQYMFLKCDVISPFEWHPFSITSAPGDDHLSVHIRALGDWTERLKTIFSEVSQSPANGKSGLDCQGENRNFPEVLIDGPYGAPSQDYKKYDVVLLVGLGIGATPMISIVKDIVNNMKAKEEEESALENGGGNGNSPLQKNKSRPTSAYFYWVTREQGSFDWFKGVMNEAAGMDKYGVIEMHNYCTSVFEEGDARGVLLWSASTNTKVETTSS
ncbi:hypothetical protein L2E82_27486 [Cichorium intybus]|uniref:Uncharacterized protein n=1 Tax=Cichorium intybus TaxID=13427 RepID=A0ACB9CT53_CICIN|nr:hypothetical protein L2E82_27486 [Cichorium intybus]